MMYVVTCPYCAGESPHVITSEYWDEVERALLDCQSLASIRDAVAQSDTGGVPGSV